MAGQLPVCRDHCSGCGQCVAVCPGRALSLAAPQPDGSGRKRAAVAARRCTACGRCLPACPRQALIMAAPGSTPP